MKNGLSIFLAGLFMLAGVLSAAPVFAEMAAAPVTPVVGATTGVKTEHGEGIEKGRHHERHPMIHEAMKKLKRAKEDLEKADHDFGGHRAKAIQSIDVALQELRAALEFDKK